MVKLTRPDVLLSVQRALLGAVSSELRGVAVELDLGVITVRFYYDGPISDDALDSATTVIAEVGADFDNLAIVKDEITRIDYPQKLPSAGIWVFKRRE